MRASKRALNVSLTRSWTYSLHVLNLNFGRIGMILISLIPLMSTHIFKKKKTRPGHRTLPRIHRRNRPRNHRRNHRRTPPWRMSRRQRRRMPWGPPPPQAPIAPSRSRRRKNPPLLKHSFSHKKSSSHKLNTRRPSLIPRRIQKTTLRHPGRRNHTKTNQA